MDLTATRQKMEKALEVVKEDLATIQVGRARPALVEKIKVEAYEGTILELRELANITVPEPQQIVISPWDKSIIKKIGQAIAKSELKLSPIIEEEIIRIKIPPLIEERRKEFEKLIQQKIESGRKIIRQIRNQAKSEIERLADEGSYSKDDIFRAKEDLQKLHDEFINKIESLALEKKQEVGI